MQAARTRCTVGEISGAIEKVHGRHRAQIHAIRGVYGQELTQGGAEMGAIEDAIARFESLEGRRPRILLAKMGQDVTTVVKKSLQRALQTSGLTWTSAPSFRLLPRPHVRLPKNDVHVVGVSSLAAGHLTLVPELKAELERVGREDIPIVVGGVIPPQDYPALREAGASAIFGPGTVIAQAALELLRELDTRLGFEQGS